MFIVDAMLGRLAKSLRMLGYDAVYSADVADSDLKLEALREGRVVLTRDREVAATGLPLRVVLVESDHLEEQLVQVVEDLGLEPGPGDFTRCLVCNATLEDVAKSEVESLVPRYVFSTQERFTRCASCGRVYWAATHVENARAWLAGVLGGAGAGEASVREDGHEEHRKESVLKRRNNIFVTGKPGVGKTTLLRSVMRQLDVAAGGFYTAEVRRGGERVGFEIVGLDGRRGVLADVGLESPYRVGKYGVNRDDLESVGVPALRAAIEDAPLIVMDEIGGMELCSELFQAAIMDALDSATPVLGTIQDRHNEFLDAVRARPDVEVIRVNTANRDCLVPVLRDSIRELLDE